MGASTRPCNKHRQSNAHTRRGLAVLLFGALVITLPALATPREELVDTTSTQSVASDTTHEISITVVKPGEETVDLTARLTTMSTNVARDVAWQVRTSQGELVLDQTASELSSKLPPGDYVVEANYGAVALREKIHIVEGNSLSVNFVLNAGGLRVLSQMQNLPIGDMPAKTMVYALSGVEKGKLLAHSTVAGELFKLPAGMYRVESRLGDGNATAVTDVRVRPGKMSAIEVTHKAGIARLNFVGAADAQVVWDVRPENGPKLTSFEGLTHTMVLKPGSYRAEAHVNGEVLSASFKIDAGEQRDIMLGN
jgi:hypothetical protein